jgi:2,2-dialkylglycine decarboxylase (pyruvate)
MAKFATGRFELVSILGAYHGLTAGSFFASSAPGFRKGQYGAGFPGIVQIPMPYEYRCEFGCGGTCNLNCTKMARMQIEGSTSGQPAALLTEFLFSSIGVVVPPPQWVAEIRKIADDYGMVRKWFGFQHYENVVPDLVVSSKTLGGGMPLSTVIVSEKMANILEDKGFLYTSSHSGDPVLAAAGLATLNIIEKDNLLENIQSTGAYLKAGLEHLMQEFEVIGDVRGRGLKLGVELVESKESKVPSLTATREFTIRCMQKGLILGNTPDSKKAVIRVLPGFHISREQVDRGVGIMEQALAETMRVVKGEASPSQSIAVPIPAR